MIDRQLTKQKLENLQHFIKSVGWDMEYFGDINSEVNIKLSRPSSVFEEDYYFYVTLKKGEVTLDKFSEEISFASVRFNLDKYIIEIIKEDPDIKIPIFQLFKDTEDIDFAHNDLANDVAWYIER